MPRSNGAKILIIEDEEFVARGLACYFDDRGYDVYTAPNGSLGVDIFRAELPDIVFTDLRMPVMGGIEVIKAIKALEPDVPIIVISGTGLIRDAVDALKCGAWDYVEKPVNEFATLEHMTLKALENSRLRSEVERLKKTLLSGGLRNPEIFSAMITRTPSLISIFQYIEVIAQTVQPVLICGETGTGKELIAKAVHGASGRKGKFVALNAAGLDDQMFSDTLFGHTRGAFTGADTARGGMIASAAHGTLFLDEIGDLKEASQIKLLRLLQEGEYHPVGSDLPLKSTARIVLATHRNLPDLVATEKFRQDLYYRLFAHQVSLPPLRERPDDIPLLLEHFLQEAAASLGKKKPTPPSELVTHLQSYRFPGNVRELRAMTYEAVTRHTQGMLPLDAFLGAMDKSAKPVACPVAGERLVVINSLGEERFPTLADAETLLIRQALTLARGNQGIAAGYLGMNRSALNKRLQRGMKPVEE